MLWVNDEMDFVTLAPDVRTGIVFSVPRERYQGIYLRLGDRP
jgi:hypothetical protein